MLLTNSFALGFKFFGVFFRSDKEDSSSVRMNELKDGFEDVRNGMFSLSSIWTGLALGFAERFGTNLGN